MKIVVEDPLVRINTPWECYPVAGRPVWVKREDLCARVGPPFSKMRGLVAHLRKRPETTFGVLDSYHSQAGWAVAAACQALDRRAIVFYPEMRHEPGWRTSQEEAARMGAEIVPLTAGRSAILWFRARAALAARDPAAHLLPNGLTLDESVAATAGELHANTPPALLGPAAAWVVSVSSGTIAAGVAGGLTTRRFRGRLVLHLGYDRSVAQVRAFLAQRAFGDPDFPFPFEILTVNEGYAYRDRVAEPAPFPCNEYYDRKAWHWIRRDPMALRPNDPVVMWNIGG